MEMRNWKAECRPEGRRYVGKKKRDSSAAQADRIVPQTIRDAKKRAGAMREEKVGLLRSE